MDTTDTDTDTVSDSVIYIGEKNKEIGKNKEKSFVKPTIEEIKECCIERNNDIDSQHFYDFYESKGWMVGKNKMKDWKACIRTWEKTKKQGNELKNKIKNDSQFGDLSRFYEN